MPIDRSELEIFAAKFALGEVSRYDIYHLADRFTSDGESSQVLIDILVGGECGEPRGLDKLLLGYLGEVNVLPPAQEFAPLDLAYRFAKAYVEDKISLLEAAGRIYQEAWLSDETHVWNLGPFVYWLDEVGDETFSTKEEAKQRLDHFTRELVKDFEAGSLEAWKRDTEERPTP